MGNTIVSRKRALVGASLLLLVLANLLLAMVSLPKAKAYGGGGQTVFALNTANELIGFNENTPGLVTSRARISGLDNGERILDIDFRPATGDLFAVSSASQIYVIDAGVATKVGKPFTPALEGSKISIDFNPTVDRIRLVTDSGQDLRLNPDTGAVAATDGRLAYNSTDANNGKTPRIVSAAYTNSFNGARSTVLYNIDSSLDILTVQTPPNNGTQNTFGALGVDTNDIAGFDIAYSALAALNSGSSSLLYNINLTNGQATLIGQIAAGEEVVGLAILLEKGSETPDSDRVYALNTSNQLLEFDRNDPVSIRSRVNIAGLSAGEKVVGRDFRTATGELFAIGSSNQVYVLDIATGVATKVGSPFTPALEGTKFTVDFNPTVDRIRVMSNTGQNLRLNPDTGAVAATDGTLAYAAGDANAGSRPNIVNGAYINSIPGATTTTLYNIDATLGILTTQNPPNNGTQNTVGSLGVATGDQVGFDISTEVLAALRPAGSRGSLLYSVNLSSGGATLIGEIGCGEEIIDLALPIGQWGRFERN
jgi:Domain of unknown function (DUF4394)